MQRKILLAVFILLNYTISAQDANPILLSPVVKTIQLSTGVNLEYAEQGEITGMPVILLHGYTDSRLSFQTVLPYLPGNLHVFALSQRGHGNSSKHQKDYHPKDFAADVAAFIKENNLQSVVIVGHSMGGIIAQQFALDYPNLTKALVIIDSNSGFKDNPELQEFFKEVSRLMDPVSYEFADAFQKSTTVKPIDPAYYKLLVEETLKLPSEVWRSAMKGFMAVDYSRELHKIKRPVLIVWGDKDTYCSKADQEVLLHEIKNSTLLVYKGTGHALHWEEPERFAKDLVEFISTLIASK